MGDHEALFAESIDGRCHKWRHYFEIYERYLAAFRNTPCVYLEIGVSQGGSLEIMRRYLGRDARIIGVDVSPDCKRLEQHGFEIMIGDQADTRFLRELAAHIGAADIIIDDGGHTPDQQITSFFLRQHHRFREAADPRAARRNALKARALRPRLLAMVDFRSAKACIGRPLAACGEPVELSERRFSAGPPG